MPSIAEITERAASAAPEPADRAICLHDFVRDNVRFGFTPYFDVASAQQTLNFGIGHCNPQARLMVALFRSAGLNARFRPVKINNDVLRGAIQTPRFLSHIFTEVEISDRWVRLDSYIVDTPLLKAAIPKLEQEQRELGYGCHVSATGIWDGQQDSFSQVATPEMILELHDPVYEIEDFYRSKVYLHTFGGVSFSNWMSPLTLIKPAAMKAMNYRVEMLRAKAR